MNKIISVVASKKVALLPFRCINQPQVVYSSTYASHYPLLQAKKIEQYHQQKLLLQAKLSCDRQMSILQKIKTKAKGFLSEKVKAKRGGFLAYERIGDDIDYNEFFKRFELPDTFQSWFLSIAIHSWMTIITVIGEKQGRLFRNSLMDSMWHDVELRLDHLMDMSRSDKKTYLKELVKQFQATLIAFDEGILKDDAALAAAAWRTLYGCKSVDPEALENTVIYIRKQLVHLSSGNIENIIFRGKVSFLSIDDVLSDNKDM